MDRGGAIAPLIFLEEEMRNLLIVIGLGFYIVGISLAGWQRTYGGSRNDWANSVIQTPDSGYILVGATYSFSPLEDSATYVYVIRLDREGDTIWTRTYGRMGFTQGASIIQANDGNYVIAGFMATDIYGYIPGFYILKIDDSGDTVWTRIFDPGDNYDGASDISAIPGGGYFVCGVWDSNTWVLKLDEDGDTIWTRLLSGWNYSILTTPDRGCVISGTAHGDVSVARLTDEGDIVWSHRYDFGRDFEIGVSITNVSFGDGYIVAGRTQILGTAICDVLAIRLNSDGGTLWTRTYGGPGIDEANSIACTFDGGFIMAGITGSYGSGDCDVYLIKIDSLGNVLWWRTYGGPERDYGRSVVQTFDGGYIAAGLTNSFGAGLYDVYIIKTDSLGETLWVREVPQKPQSISLNLFPSPFNSSCVITAPAGSDVEIYDVRGCLIWSSSIYGTSGNIRRGDLSPRSIVWTPDESVRSGIYFVRAKIGSILMERKIVYLR